MPKLPWCELRIVQAPIASAASANLCAAVTNAGGLGALSLTWRALNETSNLIRYVRRLTSGYFYANFVLQFEPRYLGVALEAGVPMVTFSFGDPTPYLDAVRRAGVPFGIQVTDVISAAKMLELNPAFLVVQGTEAGGHVQGTLPLRQILPEIVELAKDLPVFAAGGLADGEDLNEILGLGASAGVFGTRFVASLESEAHRLYKEKLLSSDGGDTVLTHCFDGDWPDTPHRVLRNSTYGMWEASGFPEKCARPGEYEVIGTSTSGASIYRYDDAMPRYDTLGDWEAMALYAGTGVGKVRDVMPAGDIVREIWAQSCSASSLQSNV